MLIYLFLNHPIQKIGLKDWVNTTRTLFEPIFPRPFDYNNAIDRMKAIAG